MMRCNKRHGSDSQKKEEINLGRVKTQTEAHCELEEKNATSMPRCFVRSRELTLMRKQHHKVKNNG